MKPADWEQIENIFHSALEIPFVERKNYLVRECAGDTALLGEVEALIKSFEQNSYFLDEPAFEFGLSAIHENAENKLKNKKIGFYVIEEKIGAGGMGDVYKAFDTRLNRPVALKFLSEPLENDYSARRQLIREAQAAAALEHPNICAVHGIEEIDGHHFIVMQYLGGKTLDEALKDRQLNAAEFTAIAKQIVSAVAFAHSHGVIHRDLKPGNIMLTEDGQIKVLDFGLAKVLHQKSILNGESDNHSTFSQSGLIIGTVAYMSPEQLRSERIDFRSDIFSLGVIFYELLTKQNPFKRASQAETIAALLSEKQVKIEESKFDELSGIRLLTEKCLEKNIQNRFQSAAEILVELDRDNEKSALETRSKNRIRRVLKACLAALILIAVLSFVFLYTGRHEQRTLAMLPISFENPQVEKEYIAVGLTQSLIDKLSNLSDLRIKDLSNDERFKGNTAEWQEALKNLKVDAVFTGSIQKRGDNLILITKIIRTYDQYVLDSEELAIEESNLTALQQYIAARINVKINTAMTDAEKQKLLRKDTDDPEAKRLYFLGRFYLSRKNKGDVTNAVKVFTEAVDLDPAFTKAWSGLADAYLSASLPGTGNAITPETAVKKAKSALEKALELDNSLSETYNSMAMVELRYEWNWKEAEKNLRTAIELNPNLIPPRIGLISVLNIQERFDEALQEADKLREVDTLSISADLETAKIYYRKREYEKAEKYLKNLHESHPLNNRLRYVQSYQLLKTGNYAEAIQILEKIYANDSESEKVLASAPLGFAYARLNRRNDALKLIENLDDYAKNNYVPSQEKAIVYLGLGDFDKAFENLNKSCREKFPSLPSLLSDPIVEELKTDKRYLDLKKCVNLPT